MAVALVFSRIWPYILGELLFGGLFSIHVFNPCSMGSQMVPLWQEDGWVSCLGSFCGVKLDKTTKRKHIHIIMGRFPDFGGTPKNGFV